MAKPEWAMFLQDSNHPYEMSTEGLEGMFTDIPSWFSMLRMVTKVHAVAEMTMYLDNGQQGIAKVIPLSRRKPTSTFANPLG